ncbi:MAG: polysaccharide deacetylase family protein [Actinomycetota bacterium]|nr:polysaccharide deacetylase family protein [Actinomycetota bacterium]
MSPAPLVLMYHGFGTRTPDADPQNLFVPVADFERHLRLIRRLYRPLDLDAYLAGWDRGRWPVRSVLVTMDDGYVSTLDDAAPLLERYGVPAVAFVCPGRFGSASEWMVQSGGEPLLTAEQVKELPEYGVEVGVHGMDHTTLPGLTDEELYAQVVRSQDELAAVLGTTPRAFAYPEGKFDDAAVRAVRDAGYAVAFSVQEGSGRFTVPRRAINTRDSAVTFGVKLLPGYARLERMSAGRPGIRRLAARLARQRPGPGGGWGGTS